MSALFGAASHVDDAMFAVEDLGELEADSGGGAGDDEDLGNEISGL